MKEKLKLIKGKISKVYLAVISGITSFMLAAVGVSAVEGDTGLDTFLTSIKTGLADFSSGNLAKVILAALALTVGLVLAWFGYRFVSRKVAGAMKKGKF